MYYWYYYINILSLYLSSSHSTYLSILLLGRKVEGTACTEATQYKARLGQLNVLIELWFCRSHSIFTLPLTWGSPGYRTLWVAYWSAFSVPFLICKMSNIRGLRALGLRTIGILNLVNLQTGFIWIVGGSYFLFYLGCYLLYFSPGNSIWFSHGSFFTFVSSLEKQILDDIWSYGQQNMSERNCRFVGWGSIYLFYLLIGFIQFFKTKFLYSKLKTNLIQPILKNSKTWLKY